MMRDYLTTYLNTGGSALSSEIRAGSEVSKVSKPAFEPFDTSQPARISGNVLPFRAGLESEPDWLRDHTDEIEERAAIMEFDGGLIRERAESLALNWARQWYAPVPF